MTEKRYRTGQIVGATLPFIIDDYSAKKHKTMTGYKAYDTKTLKKCEELTDLLNNYEDENKQLKYDRDNCRKQQIRQANKIHELFDENEQLKIDLGIAEDNHKLDKEIIDDLHEYAKKLEKENKELKDKNSQLQETLAFRSNQLVLIERLVDDLGSEEMARQMEEILE